MARIERLFPRDLFRRRLSRVFLLTLLATTIAKGAAFLPAYSIDDYLLVLQESPPSTMLDQGRFGQALLVQMLNVLQLEPHHARVFFVAFALVTWSLLATLLIRHWGLEGSGWLPLAVGGIVANHPYTTEIFTFRTALGTAVVPLALFAFLLIPRRWSPKLVLLGTAVFAIALSIYQLVLHFALMIVLMGMAIWLTRFLVAGSSRGWPARVTSLLSVQSLARQRQTALLACTLLGTTLYVVFNQLIAAALDVTLAQRTELIRPGMIGGRVEEVGEVLRYRLLPSSELLVPWLAKDLLLLLLLSAVVGLLVRMKPRFRLRPQLLFFSVAALIAVSLLWTLGLLLALRDFWPVPRVMSHVGIFWGGILAISYRCWGPLLRRSLGFLSIVIVLSFIGTNSRILNDQIRLNARDAMKANRLLARLETLPGFSRAQLVAIEGASFFYPLRFRTADHDMNISAFGAEWADLSILREISGYDLRPVKDEARQRVASEYCHGVESWPSPESVTIRGDFAIVCLGTD